MQNDEPNIELKVAAYAEARYNDESINIWTRNENKALIKTIKKYGTDYVQCKKAIPKKNLKAIMTKIYNLRTLMRKKPHCFSD